MVGHGTNLEIRNSELKNSPKVVSNRDPELNHDLRIALPRPVLQDVVASSPAPKWSCIFRLDDTRFARTAGSRDAGTSDRCLRRKQNLATIFRHLLPAERTIPPLRRTPECCLRLSLRCTSFGD